MLPVVEFEVWLLLLNEQKDFYSETCIITICVLVPKLRGCIQISMENPFKLYPISSHVDKLCGKASVDHTHIE